MYRGNRFAIEQTPLFSSGKITLLTVDALDLFHFLCLADVSLGELSDHRVGVASTVMEMNAQSQRLINVTYGYWKDSPFTKHSSGILIVSNTKHDKYKSIGANQEQGVQREKQYVPHHESFN